MRKHETEKQKKERRERYLILRFFGICPRLAVIYRDWTDNKIKMICRGEAVPIR